MKLITFFFLNNKYIINNNQVSAQDEQRPINEELQNKGAVYIRNTNEILKQTLPNRDLYLSPYLERHSSAIKPLKKTPTQPVELPLDTNSRTRIKSVRSIRIQKASH
jgi:hypothetical protein